MPELEFVRRAVADADVNALRMALIQATGDAEIRGIRAARADGAVADTVVFAPEDEERIRARAVDYLMTEPATDNLPVPTKDEIDELIVLAEARELGPDDLTMRHLVAAFPERPFQAEWTDGAVVPPGYRVAIVGAGFAGIAMGVQLAQLGIPFTVFERRDEVGGVWSINTYPDARVDTLSSTYEFSFEKKYPWTEFFARQPEVRGYLEHVARKHGVYEHIRFGADVTSARFDDASHTWTLTVAEGDAPPQRIEANVVVAASGVFATPRELPVDGVDDFGGRIVHTTAWNTGVDVAGKKVAIIGNGSTGVQLLSSIARDAAAVTVYQRTPQWISPRPGYGEPLSRELRWLVRAMPYYWNWNKYIAGLSTIDLRDLLMPDERWIADGGEVSERNDALRRILIGYITQQVDGREDLIEQLVPDYPPMTRRPVVDNHWYASLTEEHVELVSTPIEALTENAVRTEDGVTREADLVVAAVGFQTEKYLWPTEYFGTGGVSLEQAWSGRGAEAHLGMTVPGFPNLFMLYGPNSQPVASGAGLPVWMEIWCRYIATGIIAMLEGGHRSMTVRRDAFETYNRLLQKEAERLIYLSPSSALRKNYYVNEWGRLQFNAPWSGEDFYAMCERVQESDFDFE